VGTSISSESTATSARRQLALYAICFGFFLVLLDTTALNVAMAEMEREFGGAISGLQWVVNSYTIVFASLLLACGAVGDRYGAKLLYQIGLVLFTGMSLLCALSPTVGFLIGMRALQGLGAAIMLPASLSLLSHAFPNPKERTRAVAFWASIVSLGFAAGPAIGGVLTHAFGWRSIFWVNVPVGLVAWTMVARYVEESRVPDPRHIDWGGQACAALALFSLTYALIESGRSGWTAPRVLAGFGLAGILGAAFGLIERYSATPVLPRSLFAKPTFTACVTIGAFLNFGMYGTLFIESLFLQNTRHLNALLAGLVILPFTLIPTLTTRVLDRSGMRTLIKRRLVIGHLFAAAGAGLMAASIASSGYGLILGGLSLLGVGMGFIMPAMTAGVLMSSPTETSGLASGILNSARQVGGTLGVALMGTLLQLHHEHGMLWSYGLNVACYLAMAALSISALREQE
jgi:DHA2 family methylenomycin A resistance protein-like MFS transporter